MAIVAHIHPFIVGDYAHAPRTHTSAILAVLALRSSIKDSSQPLSQDCNALPPGSDFAPGGDTDALWVTAGVGTYGPPQPVPQPKRNTAPSAPPE